MNTGHLFPDLQTVQVRATMERAGFSPDVRQRYAQLTRDAHDALDASGASVAGRRTWIVPGRIEVLGKHVDYAGGRSLLCTVDRGIVLVVAPREDRVLRLQDSRRREAVVVAYDPSPYPSTQAPPQWSIYPRTVVRRLQRNFGDVLQGADVALASNLPPAAGVSSSSALTVGLTLALSAISGIADTAVWRETLATRTDLAGYVGALENGTSFGALEGERGVGTMGGAQDQTAILCCAPGTLDVFGWAPVRHERSVPWPHDMVFVIGVSGVTAAKSAAARDRYNRVARTAQHLVAAWNARGGSAATLADAFREAAHGEPAQGVPAVLGDVARGAATREFSAAHLDARLVQFHAETWRHVPDAADALSRGDLHTFGTVVAASQRGAEQALENQVPETVALVSLARAHGAVAASAFGAGFGGSVWAMVPRDDADAFMERWRTHYVTQFPRMHQRMQLHVTGPSAPAFELVGSTP